MAKKTIYGLLGRHLGHSYSKIIHEALGCSGYSLIEKEPEELKGFFGENCIGGLNVTIPYKKNVMEFCSELSEEAREIGSVNTIVTLPDGKVIGHNTDADGFVYMATRAGISFSGQKVLIFGSGGAQLAVKYAAKKMGASEILTISRSGENNYENLYRHYDADILVNATPVGMYPDMSAKVTDISNFQNAKGVLDLIYNPRRTDLLIQAESLRIPYADGLSMLVAQAVRAEELFFEKSIPGEETERILKMVARDTRNVVLIGMPGSGKSTVGAALSELSGREVIDTDAEIEKAAGITIPEIFEKSGEAGFRALEHEVIEKTGALSGKIIITGGGAVKTAENYSPLKRMGRVYHIERDTALLARGGRPLSQNADLDVMYKERLPLYEKFRDAVVPNSGTIKEAAEFIWRDFCENSCD